MYYTLHIFLFTWQFTRIKADGSTAGYVQTVAGGGTPHKGGKSDCFNADRLIDGVGTDARFSYPWGITYHAKDNTLYVGDCSCPDSTKPNQNEKIRRIALDSGQVSTVVGGTTGFKDGSGKQAQFRHVSGMVVDPATNTMYAVDSGNSRIRKIDLKSGDVSTYAGSGAIGFLDGIGSKALFTRPQSIILDNVNNRLFIGDTDNHAIRIISLKDASVTTLTGGRQGLQDGHSKQSRFFHPTGIALDTTNQLLYVADHYNHMIRVVDTHSGKVSTVAGGGRQGFQDGVGKAARFNYPEGIAYDPEYQVLYVVEFDNNAVRMVTAKGKVTTLAGGYSWGYLDGFDKNARFYHPTGMALDTKRKIIYVTDQYNHLIRSVTGLGYKGNLPQRYALQDYTQVSLLYVVFFGVGLFVTLVLTRRCWASLIHRRSKQISYHH